MADRYWVGGSGTWNNTSTTNWSATSGGGGGASVPTAVDAVIVDGSSGSPTITLGTSQNPVCQSLTTTGATCTFTGFGPLTISGNLTLSATTTWTASNSITINANSTITTNNITMAAKKKGVKKAVKKVAKKKTVKKKKK